MTPGEEREFLTQLGEEQRRALLRSLRNDFGMVLHPLEAEWNTTAEAILEAIHAAPDLTQRGVRGILSEATFRTTVVPQQLTRWRSIPFEGDLSYDLLLDDNSGELKVQVKNQRRERGAAKVDPVLTRRMGYPVHVVETQRTRNGQSTGENGEQQATRPYRFGEFDILAVCLQPSTGNWTDFIYIPGHLLLPRPGQPGLLKVMQPIYASGENGWTSDFEVAAASARAFLARGSGGQP